MWGVRTGMMATSCVKSKLATALFRLNQCFHSDGAVMVPIAGVALVAGDTLGDPGVALVARTVMVW